MISDHHLTYCTNIHPGEQWQDHFQQLKCHLPRIWKQTGRKGPHGIGLRLSAAAAEELLKPGRLDSLRTWMTENQLYLFTINGFPYGDFHGRRVKELVYEPDWGTSERLTYTLNLIQILSSLVPDGVDGGISTSPIAYKFTGRAKDGTELLITRSVHQLAETARVMTEIEERTGNELHLDIEPEPDCLLENSRETTDFFLNRLFPEGSAYLRSRYGFTAEDAVARLRRHIRICYDTCHFAVEFEPAQEALERFRSADIRIGKAQISSALNVHLTESRSELSKHLSKFSEPTYLHQVVEKRKNGTLRQYRDLDVALERIHDPEAEEWRIHFHVPVFLDQFDSLGSTREHILEAVQPLKASGCSHYEVETYTWGILPETLRRDLPTSVQRELEWTAEAFDFSPS